MPTDLIPIYNRKLQQNRNQSNIWGIQGIILKMINQVVEYGQNIHFQPKKNRESEVSMIMIFV